MSYRARILVAVFSALLVAVAGLPAPQSASADVGGIKVENPYYNDKGTIPLEAPDWMRWVANSVLLSDLSIPGTHDTMSLHGNGLGPYAEAQSMSLKEQLESGIRSLDIRVLRARGIGGGFHSPEYLTITHGPVLQKAMFGQDVLQPIVTFLKANPTETVVVKITEDAREVLGNIFGRFNEAWVKEKLGAEGVAFANWWVGGSVADILENYLSDCSADAYPTQGSSELDPCSEYGGAPGDDVYGDVYGDYVYGWDGTTFVGSDNPTMGELRGKIFVVGQLPLGPVDSVPPTGDLGFTSVEQKFPRGCDSCPNLFSKKGVGSIPWDKTTWDGWAWNKIQDHLDVTAAGTTATFYYTNLAGVGETGVPFPWQVAYGRGHNFGMNKKAYEHLLEGQQQRTTGILVMDFPGAGLIAEIIAHNFWHSTFPEYKEDLHSLMDQILRGAKYKLDEIDPPDTGETARDRGFHLSNFLQHVVHDQPLNVTALKAKWAAIPKFSGQPPEYVELHYRLEGMNYWVWAPRSLSSEIDMQGADFWAWMNAAVSNLGTSPKDAEGVRARADALRNAAEDAYPEQDWVAFVKLGDGDDENWYCSVHGEPPQLVDSNGFQHLLFGESRNDPPVADAGGPYLAEEGSELTFDGTASADPDGDALVYTWNLSPAVPAFDGATGPTVSHTFDDDYSGMVTVTVEDPGGFTDTASATVEVTNVAPVLSNLVGDEVNEGSFAHLSGKISDVGVEDSFTVTVDWQDGYAPDEVAYPAGTTAFDLDHQYLDDKPSGTPSDTYQASVTVTDDDGGSTTETVAMVVNNVAPMLDIYAVADGRPFTPVGIEVEVEAVWGEVGVLDTLTGTIDWGDGTVSNLGDVMWGIAGTHVYDTAGIYDIAVTVTDDDTGATTETVEIDIRDAADMSDGVADELLDLMDGADPAIREAIHGAIDDLIGNNNGRASNGAEDQFAKGNLAAALGKLSEAAAQLEGIDGFDADSQLVLLALTAQSAAETAVAEAREAAGCTDLNAVTCSKGERNKVTSVETLLADGRAAIELGEHVAAIEAFKDAIQRT